MSRLNIEIDENQLRKLVLDYLRDRLGDVELDFTKVNIEVKSKQNYKSEWEPARFRATYSATI